MEMRRHVEDAEEKESLMRRGLRLIWDDTEKY